MGQVLYLHGGGTMGKKTLFAPKLELEKEEGGQEYKMAATINEQGC